MVYVMVPLGGSYRGLGYRVSGTPANIVEP